MSVLSVFVIALHHEPSHHSIAPFKLLHGIFLIRVDAANKAVYKLVAEPTQEQQAGEPQAEVAVKPIPEEVANPADLQGKPRSITLTFSIKCVSKYLCIYVYRSCMKP